MRSLNDNGIILMGHEDDHDDDVNMLSYPFENYGYKVRSIQGNFDVCLGYKIERHVIKGFEVDTEMSISAITSGVTA